MTGVTARRALPTEQEAVEALSQTDKATKEFKYLWRRFDNWTEASTPIVAVDTDGALIGFHAAAFGRAYVNSYYQLTTAQARGRRVGGTMVEFLLVEAHRLRCVRLKFKVPPGSAGQRFWEGFGVLPFATDAKHALYDISLEGVRTAADLKRADCTPPVQLQLKYLRRGATLLENSGLFQHMKETL